MPLKPFNILDRVVDKGQGPDGVVARYTVCQWMGPRGQWHYKMTVTPLMRRSNREHVACFEEDMGGDFATAEEAGCQPCRGCLIRFKSLHAMEPT